MIEEEIPLSNDPLPCKSVTELFKGAKFKAGFESEIN